MAAKLFSYRLPVTFVSRLRSSFPAYFLVPSLLWHLPIRNARPTPPVQRLRLTLMPWPRPRFLPWRRRPPVRRAPLPMPPVLKAKQPGRGARGGKAALAQMAQPAQPVRPVQLVPPAQRAQRAQRAHRAHRARLDARAKKAEKTLTEGQTRGRAPKALTGI